MKSVCFNTGRIFIRGYGGVRPSCVAQVVFVFCVSGNLQSQRPWLAERAVQPPSLLAWRLSQIQLLGCTFSYLYLQEIIFLRLRFKGYFRDQSVCLFIQKRDNSSHLWTDLIFTISKELIKTHTHAHTHTHMQAHTLKMGENSEISIGKFFFHL